MITMQDRKERIEDILDERLGMIENGEVNTITRQGISQI